MRERSFTRKLPPLTTRATSRGSGSETQSVVSGASDERLYTQKPPPPTTRGLSGGSGSTTHGLVSRVSDESLMRERSFTRKLSSPITRATSRGWGSETESEISRVSNEQLFTKKLPPPTTRARSGSDQSQVSRVSNETVLRERLFPQRLPPPTKPVPPVRKSESSTCSVCSARCLACPNPWQRTRSDLMVAEINRPKPVPYGITLKPCDHVFCGACLAQTIYHCLDMAFDSATYGTKLPSYAHDGLDPGRPDFPVLCPVWLLAPS
ncbi:hypothetical protein K438DRAFT_937416 [Mycena galopus ATCC 62051]|nr:hypothetical protein K438DRAFT_937416 [Mycena galopus ATCC 62051]